MKVWRIAIAMLAAFCHAFCSREDGYWDPMVWRAEVPVVKATDGIYMQKGKRHWETGEKTLGNREKVIEKLVAAGRPH